MKLVVTDAIGVTVPEDVYKAKVVKLEPRDIVWDTSIRSVLEFTFEITDDAEYEGVQLRGIATLVERLTPKSKLRAWAEAILGQKLNEGDELDTDMLLGKSCRINVIVEPGKNGGQFNKVKDVLPLRSRPQAVKTGTDNERY